jgi:hypothetical protein
MSRDLFFNVDGVDEQSSVPDGGLANLDFFAPAVTAADCVFTLLGEGTFQSSPWRCRNGIN